MCEELIQRLQRHTESYVAYKIDADFASAVQEAVSVIEEFGRSNKTATKTIDSMARELARDTAQAPVWKEGESVIHVSRADSTGGFETNEWADWTCPVCGWFVGEQYIPRRHNQQKCNYCSRCGQKIDWAKVEKPKEEA